MYIFRHKKKVYFLLYFVFLLFVIYAFQEFYTIINFGTERGTARESVHVALFAILLTLGWYYVMTMARGVIVKSPVKLSLWLITGWISFVNLLQDVDVDPWNIATQLGMCVLWILTYHFFSSYLRNTPRAWSQMQVCITTLFVVYVCFALYMSHVIYTTFNNITAINFVYGVIVFLPWIIMVTNGIKQYLCIVIIFIVSLISMKRGAIIACPLMINTYLVIEVAAKRKKLVNVLKYFIAVATILVTISLFADQIGSGYLNERFSHEEIALGSQRPELYSASLKDIMQRNEMDMLCGRGSWSSVKYLGTSTHNEWLEFFFCYGVIGVVLYGLLFLALTRQVKQLIIIKSCYASIYATAVVYMFVVGLTHQVYFSLSTSYLMALFGTIEGLVQNDSKIFTYSHVSCCNQINKVRKSHL